MKLLRSRWPAVSVLAAAVVLFLLTCRAETQDVSLNPLYGTANLKAGFLPDPYKVKVVAGGPIQTKLGGVTAWVAKAPDFRLNYRAGSAALTFYVEAPQDTTLLINDPDGKWFADDGNGNLNPKIRFANPKSGQYDIWIGSFNRDQNPNAVLYITELR
jgi:hypothetical protein